MPTHPGCALVGVYVCVCWVGGQLENAAPFLPVEGVRTAHVPFHLWRPMISSGYEASSTGPGSVGLAWPPASPEIGSRTLARLINIPLPGGHLTGSKGWKPPIPTALWVIEKVVASKEPYGLKDDCLSVSGGWVGIWPSHLSIKNSIYCLCWEKRLATCPP